MADDVNKSGRPINGDNMDQIRKKYIEESTEYRPQSGHHRSIIDVQAAEAAREMERERIEVVREAAKRKIKHGTPEWTKMNSATERYIQQGDLFRNISYAASMQTSEINRLAGRPELISSARANIGEPTADLQNAVTRGYEEINQLGKKAMKSVYSGEAVNNPDILKDIASETHKKLSGVARAEAALKLQRQSGVDTASIESDISKRDATLRAKPFKSKEEQDLLKSFEQFNKMLAESASEAHRFGQATLKAAEDLERQTKAGGSNWQRYGNYALGLASGMNSVTDVGRYGLIQTPLQLAQQQGGYANIVNRQFNDYMSATHGDMAALLRLSGGAYNQAGAFGGTLGSRERVAAGADAAVGVLSTAGNAAVAFGSRGGSLTSRGMGSAGAVASSAAGAANNLINVYNGTSAHQTGLDAYNVSLDRFNAYSAIPAASAQAFYDLTTGSMMSTRGAGLTNRSRMFDTMLNPAFTGAAANIGLSATDINEYTAAGVTASGSQFDVGSVTAARLAERNGSLTMGQYAGAVGALNAVGGSSKDLEIILQSAVSKGMDASKNIQMMVSATTALSAGSAAVGIGTASGMGATIAGMIHGGTGNDLMELTSAQNTAAQVNAHMTDTGLNMRNVMRLGAVERMGARGVDARNLALGINLSQMSTLMRGSPAEQQALLKAMGSSADVLMTNGKLDKSKVDQLGEAVLQGEMAGNVTWLSESGVSQKDAMDVMTGRNKNPQLIRKMRAATFNQTNLGQMMDLFSGGPQGPGFQPDIAAKNKVQSAEDIRNAAAKSQDKLQQEGAQGFGNVQNMSSFVNMVADSLNVKEMAKAAVTAGEKFELSSGTFSVAVDKFSKVVDRLSPGGIPAPDRFEAGGGTGKSKVPVDARPFGAFTQ